MQTVITHGADLYLGRIPDALLVQLRPGEKLWVGDEGLRLYLDECDPVHLNGDPVLFLFKVRDTKPAMVDPTEAIRDFFSRFGWAMVKQ